MAATQAQGQEIEVKQLFTPRVMEDLVIFTPDINAEGLWKMEELYIALNAAFVLSSLKEFLGSYNRMTELCFLDCVSDFTSRKPSDSELSCSHRCLEKFLKVSQRVTTRFQEYQVQQNEGLLAAQSKMTR